MPIDSSIPLQAQTPNLAQLYLQAEQLKGAQQERQIRSLSLAQAMRAQQDELDTRNAIEKAGDITKAPDLLAQTNPYAANKLKVQIAEQQQKVAKGDADLQKVQLENRAAQTQGFASLLDGVQNAADYQGRIQTALQKGFINQDDLQHLPAYSPEAVKQLQNAALTHNQQLTSQLQQQNAAETARHNAQTEATAAATQEETAKYHGIEAAQRRQQIGIEAGHLALDKQRYGTDMDTANEAQAQQIANGEVKALSLSRNNPRTAAIMKRVYEINPNYSDSLYTMTQALRSDKPNSMGANVSRLGTAVLHADAALKNSHNLGFSEGLLTGIPTEKTAPYKQDAEFLTGEIGQFVTGGKLTVDEGNKISKDLMSSRQGVRDAAIHQILDLAGGKLKSQMQQYKNATKNEFPSERVFNDPDISGALQKHGIIGGPQQQPSGGMIRARDPQGQLHEAPAGTPLPKGWVLE